jgi:sugar lactone lactonase YvrE
MEMSIAHLSVALACPFLASGTALAQTQLLVSDGGGSKVVRYKYPSGLAFDHFVGAGLSPLSSAHGMTIGPDGLLYVCGYSTEGVLRYSAVTGEYLGTFAAVARPVDLEFGPDGYLYVSSEWHDRIERHDPVTGNFVNIAVAAGEGGLSNTYGFTIDDNGVFYVASYSTSNVLKFDPAGDFIEAIDLSVVGLTGAINADFDLQGNLIVSGYTSNSMAKVTPNGLVSLLVSPNLGGLVNPYFFDFDDDGNLVVASTGGNGAVLKYDKNGQYLGTVINSFGGGLSGDPIGILFLPPAEEECTPDFDGNGLLDLFDFLAFVNAFNAGC